MSTSGIDELLDKSSMKQALIFRDPICPNCDNSNLVLVHMPLYGDKISIRYECRSCGFICPVGRDNDDLEEEYPLYDNSVNEFVEDFIRINNEEKDRKAARIIIKPKRKKKKKK